MGASIAAVLAAVTVDIKARCYQPAEPRPSSSKRRIQRIDSDDEDLVAVPSYDQDVSEPRLKKARTVSRGPSNDSGEDDYGGADEDIDIEGDIEDTRFLPDPPPSTSRPISPAQTTKRRLSNATASSSKSRTKDKELKSSKPSKSSGKKRRAAVVWTDDEDEDEFNDPDVVVTDDDDFDPEPGFSSKKGAVKGKSGKAFGKSSGKGAAGKKEDKEITFRDERKLTQPPAPESVRRAKEDEVAKPAPEFMDEPIPKKRKLPPIKKNKPVGSTSTGPSTPAPRAAAATPAKKEEPASNTTLTPAPTSNQVGVRKPAGASTDLNLLDSSVYSELFLRAPGGSTPNSGLNRKQKEEERKKELNKMRNEARAKRDAEGRHAFDLQSGPEKIQRYEEVLRTRHSTARYPNLLGAAFKEMSERNRARLAAQQG
uniref:Alcohol oxidase n=1 Tax=Ganoderma boninense TaxID=34458 RepID=A0A5K1JZ43_9APHY|nr:Alcohol oxidase [Ganoderma boninense]